MFDREYIIYMDYRPYEIKAANIEKCVNKFGKLLGWDGAFIYSACGGNFVIKQLLPKHLREEEIPMSAYITIYDANGNIAWR